MKKTIELHKKDIDYTLKISKRARRMRLAVYCDGSLTVTTPRYMNQGIVERFIIQKSQWILDKIDYFKSFDQVFFIKNTKTNYLKNRDYAKQFAELKVEKFNKIYKYKFNSINIKNQKTRWGSCSKKGNLNFNYKISLLPEKIAEYIIVHEICHLGEFNHSQKFWNLVAKTIPDYLDIRADLRK